MATKTANVTARISPEIKQQAEAVLIKLGIPVSVLIDSLYRQIIMTNGIPYSLSVPTIEARDIMSDEEFDRMLDEGLRQAQNDDGMVIDESFEIMRRSI